MEEVTSFNNNTPVISGEKLYHAKPNGEISFPINQKLNNSSLPTFEEPWIETNTPIKGNELSIVHIKAQLGTIWLLSNI